MNLSSRYVTIMIITLPAPTLSLAIPLPALRELCLFSGEHWASSPSPLAFNGRPLTCPPSSGRGEEEWDTDSLKP